MRLRPAGGGFGLTRQRYATALLALMAVTVAVFLIACANLASLVAARLSARRHEIATRLALGAGRAGLLRYLLIESLVLSTGGSLVENATHPSTVAPRLVRSTQAFHH